MSRIRVAFCVSRYCRLNSESCLPSLVHFATVHHEDESSALHLRDASFRLSLADLRQPFAHNTSRGFASAGSDATAKDLDTRKQDAMAVLKVCWRLVPALHGLLKSDQQPMSCSMPSWESCEIICNRHLRLRLMSARQSC